MENLINTIKTIKQNINKGSYRSEEAVRVQVCNLILQELGWDTGSPDQVALEYNIDNLRVDIALCHLPGRPVVFIEVKASGKCSARGEEQIFDYAARKGGVPMIILTDGNEWHFYNTHGSGDPELGYESRKVKNIQLTKDDSDDCVKYFCRYLEYGRVKTKQALKDLVSDHERIEKKREAKLKIPEAWNLLVNDSDEMLVDIIIDKVNGVSDGEHTPEKEDVLEFLKGLKRVNKPEKPPYIPPTGHSPPTGGVSEAEKVVHRYKINEQIRNGKNGKDVYMKVLDYVLTEYVRFEELKNQKFNKMKSRALGTGYHISENGNEIPKGMEHKTKLMTSGKWVNTNMSAANMSAKLVEIGGFYNHVENRKILGVWGSGAEVEFDIPTRPSSS